MRGDLGLPLLPRLLGSVDLLLFNPPYVPSPEEEVGGEKAAAAWAGGLLGRRVIDRFLPIVADLLSPAGAAYVVLVRENRVAEVARAGLRLGLLCERVAGTRAMNERLMVVRFTRLASGRSAGPLSEAESASPASQHGTQAAAGGGGGDSGDLVAGMGSDGDSRKADKPLGPIAQ